MLDRALPWLLLAALACAGLQTWRLSTEQTAHARSIADHARQIAELERNGREAVIAVRNEETRRFMTLWGIADETKAALDRARADAAGAADAGVRLRRQLATLSATRCGAAPHDPALASGSPPADATADLLTDVQRRLDEAADGIARHADEAHIAGRACERAYDALIGADANP